MRILVTSARMPFALDMIRKLDTRGHDVYASDADGVAPGSHSRYLAGHFVTASPKNETERFLDDIERIVTENEIEAVIPAFEEAFFLATRLDRLSKLTTLYTAPFRTLARLHDKAVFQRLATDLELPIPETVIARSDDELREAIGRFPRFFARAAFSRGGVALLTNTGPLAGQLSVDDVHPTERSPWLVQEFVDGPMLCTYSTLHAGRPTLHCTYRAPRQWEHSTGIQFESVDSERTLPIVERITSHLGYTGQVSFDFVDTGDELMLIECNPRATDGILLVPADELSEGLLLSERGLAVIPAGERVQLDFAVFGEMFTEGLGGVPRGIEDLRRIRSYESGWHDHLPFLYSFLDFAQHAKLNLRDREPLLAAMADDITWDGEPIAGLSAEDSEFLDRLEAEGLGSG